jgi:hypothetical protein
MQINQSSVIERKGIYSNISEINKNKQYILYVLPLILYAVRRYKRGNQNPSIEECQKTKRPKEKAQKVKQRSTKHYTENLRSSNTNPTSQNRQ